VVTNHSALFDALGDPTRRALLELLTAGPLPVRALAEQLPISRPAVSQHLKVLKDAGLVVDHASGTRRLYELDPDGPNAVHAWVSRVWDTALQAFKTAAEQPSEEES
jgi:DNA-binding transcriptional ArsR family regulator